MLIVRQCVDGRNVAELGELFDIALSESADYRTMKHATHDPCGVLNRFAASKLNIVGRKEHHVAT